MPLTTAQGLHIIHCRVMQNGWSVTFHDYANPDTKFPWLLCDSQDEVLKILAWGHISGPDLDEHHRDIARWGVGGGKLRLTTRSSPEASDGHGTATSSRR